MTDDSEVTGVNQNPPEETGPIKESLNPEIIISKPEVVSRKAWPKGKHAFDAEGMTPPQRATLDLVKSEGFIMSVTEIAQKVGVTRQTVWSWLNKPQHREFQRRWQDIGHQRALAGVPMALDTVIDEIRDKGKGKLIASKLLLEYAGKMVHKTESKSIQINSDMDLTKLTAEQLQQLREMFGRK